MDFKSPRDVQTTSVNNGKILKDVIGFFQNILMDLHDELKLILSNSGVDHTQLQGFDQLFSAKSYTNPVLLGIERQWTGSGKKRRYAEV